MKRRLLGMTALAAMLAVPLVRADQDVAEVIERARRLAAGQMMSTALELLEPLRQGPHAADVLTASAQIRGMAGDWSGAADDYLELLELEPDEVVAFRNLLICLERAGRDEEAGKVLADLPEVLARDARVMVVRGLLASRTGDDEAARAELRRAVSVDPDDKFAPYELGLFLLARGEAAEAAEVLEEASRRAPDDPAILYNFAQALLRSGERARGGEILERAQELSRRQEEIVNRRSRAVALTYRARDAWNRGDRDTARRDIEEALSLSPDDPLIARLRAQMNAEDQP